MEDYGRFEHSDDVKNKRIVIRDLYNNVYKVIWEVDKKASPDSAKYTKPKLERFNKSSFKYFYNDYIIIDIPMDLTEDENIKNAINNLYDFRSYFIPIDESCETVEGYIPVYTSKYYYRDKPIVIINYADKKYLDDYRFVRAHLSIELGSNFMNDTNRRFKRQLNFIGCGFANFHGSTKSKFVYDGDYAYYNENDYFRKYELSTTLLNVDAITNRCGFKNEFENVYGLISNSSIVNSKLSGFFAWMKYVTIDNSEISHIVDDDIVWAEDFIPTIIANVYIPFKHTLELRHSKLLINNKFRYTDEDFERDDLICDEESGSIFIDIKEPLKLTNQYVTLDLNVIPYTTKTIKKSDIKKIEKVGHVKL